MKQHITSRCLVLAEHILETKDTVRDTAKVFGISKSTVHKDVTERLRDLDVALFESVREVLEYNLSIRHIRGGEATKEKYKI
ncbi:MAG: sporulation transcriptional regulator SpoIIID [Firmicutes bacterium]|nr:sporulation transcriptional regulator SpoIIID [Bacillota bacterium]